MCQGCVADGELTQATFDAIETFLERYPDAGFGPAHIVLSDCNVDNECIDRCLNEAYRTPITDNLVATISFLRMLRTIPEDYR